jgi:hypothetical protein
VEALLSHLRCGCWPQLRRKTVANLKFDKEIPAILVIDPYNDFISDGGKVWDRLTKWHGQSD